MQGLDVNLGGHSGTSAGLGGALGSFIGSALINGGWGGNLNRVNADTAIGLESIALDAINNVNASILAGNMAAAEGRCETNSTIFQTGANTQAAITANGFNLSREIADTKYEGAQGLNALSTIMQLGQKDIALQTSQSTGAIVSAIQDCCCKTSTAMAAGFAGVNQHLDAIVTQNLRDQLCAKDGEIAFLKTTGEIDSKIAASTAVILASLKSKG